MYQGKICNSANSPVVSPVTVLFTIYDSKTEGTALYQASIELTPDQAGIFTVELGPFEDNLFDGSTRFIGMKVGSDDEMSPRQPIGAAPYALNSSDPILPGLASRFNNDLHNLTSLVTTIDSVVISCPGPGFLTVSATGFFMLSHNEFGGDHWGRAFLSVVPDTTDFDNYAVFSIPSGSAGGDYRNDFSITMIDTVISSGEYTYYLNADHHGEHIENTSIARCKIVATYFPKSYDIQTRDINTNLSQIKGDKK